MPIAPDPDGSDVEPWADPYCATCGHGDHTDPINGDFCFRVTSGGLCGCEQWEPVDREDDYDDAYEEPIGDGEPYAK